MLSQADAKNNIPRHVAIIMDGNGRWAQARGLGRLEGHKAGAEAARIVVESAKEAGVEYLTLFSFSSENWSRPVDEVNGLMDLLRFYLKKEMAELHKKGAKLRVIGDRERLPADIVQLILSAEDLTKDNTEITVVIALSYGGRQDISYAARDIARRVKEGSLLPENINEDVFAQSLMTDGIPDPDLLVRTSGEARISNFLLWQLAYAEMYFTERLWPDFSKKDFLEAIDFYAGRDRRFGGLSKRNKA